MLIPVHIDFSDFANKMGLRLSETEALAETVLRNVTSGFMKSWINTAEKELHQTRQEYVNSIYVEQIRPLTWVVGLRGIFPNMLEQGATPFDMKEGFSQSSKKKLKKDGGWYLTIPFRHATPTALAVASIFTDRLPKEVYAIAKRELTNSQMQLKTSQLPLNYQDTLIRPEILDKVNNQIYPQYEHKSPLYTGLKRSDLPNNGQYTTFRRVSDLSDSNSWIHTGLQARKFAEKALNSFDIGNVVAKAKVDFYNNR